MRLLSEDDDGWRGLFGEDERQILCTAHNLTLDGGDKNPTPRGQPSDLVTSCLGGALCGYLAVQLATLVVYMNAPVLRPKQPHALLLQTLAASIPTCAARTCTSR